MRHLTGGAAVLAALLLAPTGSVSSQETPACGEMHLLQAAETIVFVDHGEEGIGPGDQRILHWVVKDLDQHEIGAFYVLTTVLEVLEDGDVAMAVGHIVFPNGDLSVSVMGTLRDAANTERSNQTAITWSINGGTGAFVGATGELINGPPADDAEDLEHWTLDIYAACPGTED